MTLLTLLLLEVAMLPDNSPPKGQYGTLHSAHTSFCSSSTASPAWDPASSYQASMPVVVHLKYILQKKMQKYFHTHLCLHNTYS